ncbi:MurR/RpiR family transcriptional regulator [Erysipelotrichaceae bacterium 51-3]
MLLSDKFCLTDFSESEQIVVNYLMEQGEAVRNRTTKEIAQATFTSPSTLIRIAHKMGFDGWVSLREEWLKEKNYLDTVNLDVDANIPFNTQNSQIEIARNLALLEQNALQDTLNLLDSDQLFQAVTRMDHAQTLYILTDPFNQAALQSFQLNMQRLHRSVVLTNCPATSAYIATKQDCILIISYSGELEILKECVAIVKERGLSYISITGLGDNSIEQDAAVALRICTREKLTDKIANFTVNIALTYLMDVLFGCIYQKNFESNLSRRQEIGRILEKDRRLSSLAALDREA